MCTGKTCHSKSPSGWWSRKKKVFHKGAFLCSQCRTLPINIGLWWCCFECWWLDAWPPQKTLIRHWWRFPVRAFLLFLLLMSVSLWHDPRSLSLSTRSVGLLRNVHMHSIRPQFLLNSSVYAQSVELLPICCRLGHELWLFLKGHSVWSISMVMVDLPWDNINNKTLKCGCCWSSDPV